jgi:uncharacterized protein
LIDNSGVGDRTNNPSLLLFAKAPEAGRVKTRLAPVLGAAGAALLYRAFLEDAGRCYGPPSSWSAVLCADPDPAGPSLRALFPPPWRGETQSSGDLGRRLSAAFRGEFRRGAPAAVAVGADHPGLRRWRLEEMFARLLSRAPAVLIPAEDGGYCAIGLDAGVPVEEVFRAVPWSSSDALAVTLERLAAAGLSVELLPATYDVDRPADLDRLRAEVARRDPSEADYPRATAAALSSLRGAGAT